jgi:hypothetical protein
LFFLVYSLFYILKLPKSNFIPGPIVGLIITPLIKSPLTPEGLSFEIVSTKNLIFETSSALLNFDLPTPE